MPASESDAHFTIWAIACGHGDTLLIRLPNNHWALIDCHLRENLVKAQFFDLLKSLNVDRLDYLILTHPHSDHYHGMPDVINYFTSHGRSIGIYCDVGVAPVDVIQLLESVGRPTSEVKEYVKLVRSLDALFKINAVEYQPVSEGIYPLDAGGKSGFQLIPVGPKAGLSARMTRDYLAERTPSESLNSLSIQLLLRVEGDGEHIEMFLAADADTADVKNALTIWADHRENGSGKVQFRLIKVPHHGSRNGHCHQLTLSGSVGTMNLAVISADTKYRLPKRTVIEDYKNAGWTALTTTTRTDVVNTNHPLMAFAQGPKSRYVAARENIEIRWHGKNGLSWTPQTAEVSAAQLQHYFP